MSKTPLALVKESHGDKAKLVAAIQKLATADLWLDRVNSEKGLGRVSNAKLLRLLAALEDAKKRFGSRAKLIAAVQELEKRTKDDGYKARLEAYPLPRLLDLHDAAKKRVDGAAKKASGVKKAPKVAKAVKKAAPKVEKAPVKKGAKKAAKKK